MVEGSITVAQGINHDPAIHQDEASRLLRELQMDICDQDDLERDIERQADRLLMEQADERDQRRWERTANEKRKFEAQILKMHQRLSQPVGTAARVRIGADLEKAQSRGPSRRDYLTLLILNLTAIFTSLAITNELSIP